MALRSFRIVPVLLAVLMAACGGGGGGGGGGSSTPPPVTVAMTPNAATLTALATQQFHVTVSNTSNYQVAFSVQEGAAGGSVDSSGLYTSPAAPGTYHVVATSQADSSKSATSTVTVVAAPSIASFTASPSTITAGSTTTLTATFSGGTGSVDHSLGAVTSGAAIATGSIPASTLFTLTVTNAAGTSVTAQTTVTAVAAPSISAFTASPTLIGSGSTTTLTGTFSGGSGSVNQGVGAVSSGVGKSSAALSADTTFTLTVTNAAGTSVTAQASVTVVTAPPTISSFTATPTTITLGNSSTLAWSVTGQAVSAISIDQGIGSVAASGNTLVSPTTATTYTLTATNPKGSSTATATVTVVFAPQISSFKATVTTVVSGGSSTITPVFSQGTGAIDQGIGAVVSGTSYPTGALSAAKTYTLTVTNSAGDSVTKQLTVHVDPGTFSPAGGTMSTPRHFHTSIALANGKVLVAGGSGTSGYLNTAEEFDPAANGGTGGFTLTAGNLGSVRGYPTGVLLADGRAMVIGGLDSSPFPSDYLNTVDLYDPAARTFSPSAHTLANARIQCSATLLPNGKVLIAGGNNATTTYIGTAELYDPVTDTFTLTAGTMGTPRWGQLATLLGNGKVLITGGQGSSGSAPAELYDPQTDSFVPTGNASTDGNWYTMTRLQNGQILLALSGVNGNAATLYDPASGLGSATGSVGLTRYSGPTATLMADGRVLIAGNSGAPGFEVAADGEIYSSGTGLFTYTGNLGDRGQQTAHLLQSGKVVLIGGFSYGGTGVLNTASLYDAGPAVAAPAPNATITAPGSVLNGATGQAASVPTTAGAVYYWTIQGGTITAGLGTSAVTFTAGAPGTLILHCLVLSAAGIPAHGQASVTVN